jgi:hypothetical protein
MSIFINHSLYMNYSNLFLISDAGGSESDDVELSDCTIMALKYLEQADQCKIGKKS